MYNERRDEDWINPPEEKDEYEPDVDRENDAKWLDEHDDDTADEYDEHDCCRGDCK